MSGRELPSMSFTRGLTLFLFVYLQSLFIVINYIQICLKNIIPRKYSHWTDNSKTIVQPEAILKNKNDFRHKLKIIFTYIITIN